MTDNIYRLAVKELAECYEVWQRNYKYRKPEYGIVLSVAIFALEKQIPTLPVRGTNLLGQDGWFCPTCGAVAVSLGEDGSLADYCPECGQALGWESD